MAEPLDGVVYHDFAVGNGEVSMDEVNGEVPAEATRENESEKLGMGPGVLAGSLPHIVNKGKGIV